MEISEEQQYSFTADAPDIRIDRFLTDLLEDTSRSYIQRLIKEGNVTVNRRTIKANYKTVPGDQISVRVPRPATPDILPQNIPLDILYEDEDILIVNKPKGMVVHPAAGHYSDTLVNALMYHCKDQLSGINGILRPGIVHRIDMDTTGSLIVCKNDLAHRILAEQLKNHSITRKYHAIVHGNLKADGKIDAPIGRHPTDRKKMSTTAKHAKEAVTHYHILKRYRNYTYIECELETGRTHQIRVHMASIGHPILGDAVYGPARCPYRDLQGQTLHAKILGFFHPRTGIYLEFDAPLPEYFSHLLEILPL